MTAHDEDLRALEKKWREAGDAETARADGIGLSDGEQGWHHGRGEQYDNCADELAALLTTRQEVAPVADGAALLVRDVCEMAPADPDAPDTVCIRVADLTRIAELYTSTGQTSDARDGDVQPMDVLSLADLVDAAVCLERCEECFCGDEMELAAPRRRLAKAYSGLRTTLFQAQDALECALRNSKRGSRTNAACSTALEYLRRATKQSEDDAQEQPR